MSSAFQVIVGELRRRLLEGEAHCVASDETLAQLRAWAADLAPPRDATPPPPEPSVTMAPPTPARSNGASALSGAAGRPQKPKAAPAAKPVRKLPPPPEIPPLGGSRIEQLKDLREQVLACDVGRGELREGGNLVFGEGNPEARLFFVGEAPGPTEDEQGRPFVGPAGELLDKMIVAMGLKRADVYIANILTWRPRHDKPTGNRPPTPEEMAFALPYLMAQIGIVQPAVLVALGNTAVTGLLGPDPKRRLRDIRGTWQTFDDTPLMVTYHPSYLLHNGTKATKRQAWEDLLQVMERLELPISERQRRYFL